MSVAVAEFAWQYTPTQGELSRDDDSFEQWCSQAMEDWARHFPVRRGYTLLTLPLPDGARGVRLSALRGDFRADLDLRWSPDLLSRELGAGSLRVHSQARSSCLAKAQDRALAWSSVCWQARAWLAPLMYLLGAVCILSSATWSHLILVGVLSFVVGVFLSYAGLWREHLQGRLHAQAWSDMLSDGAVQGDLRRWRALGQVLERRRKDLSLSKRNTPFRRVSRNALAYKCA